MDNTILLDYEEKEAERWLREGLFHNYWKLSALGESWLADTSLIEACLLAGDEDSVQARGVAVQVTLDWALEKLREGGGWASFGAVEYYRQSADVLQKRYVEGLSNRQYADLRIIDDQTAHSRRKKAIQRVLQILGQELQAPSCALRRKQLMIERRYADCSAEEQLLLRLVAISSSPSSVGAAVGTCFGEAIAIDLVRQVEDIALENCIFPLLSKNLLLSDDEMRQLDVHPELRHYLLTLLTPDERLRWYRAIAAFYEQQCDWSRAVPHYQLAGLPLAAAALLIGQANDARSERFSAPSLVVPTGHDMSEGALPLADLQGHLAAFKQADLPLDIWAQLKIMAGRAAELSKELEVAIEAYREALAAEDDVIKAEAYYLLACLYEQQDIDAAFEHYEACKRHLTTANTAKSRELLANAALRQAWLFIVHRPDFEKAEENLQEAQQILSCYEQEHSLRSDLHTTWGTFYMYSPSPQANPQLEYQHRWRAWQEASEAQDIELLINTTYNLAISCIRTGKYEQARRHLQQSQTLAKQAGNKRMEVLSQKGIGDCYRLGSLEYDKAIEYYLEAYHDFDSKGYDYWQAEVCEDLVEAYIALGKTLQAKKYFDQGLLLADQLENNPLKAKFAMLAESYIELTPGLQNRQRQAIGYIRQKGSISNKELRQLTGVKSNRTAASDLNKLVERGICVKVGKGRATRYELAE
jgi:tetratricopeptide (TPR) repeat protein